MTHYKPNQDKTMLVEVPPNLPAMRAEDFPFISFQYNYWELMHREYNRKVASLKSYPAHPSLIEWMQGEGKEVITDKEFEMKGNCTEATCPMDMSCLGCEIVAYPLPQTEDVWDSLKLDFYRAVEGEITFKDLKSKYHLTLKL